MPKLILLSILLFTVGVPIVMAKRPAPHRSLRALQLWTVVAALAWAYACLTWYPQLVPID